MKLIYTLFFISVIFKTNAQVGIGTSTPNADAVLEISSPDKAVLITKISLTSTDLATPLASHNAGMIVYNTNTNGSGDTKVSPGLYYNNGTKWVKLEPIAIGIGDVKHTMATTDHLGWYKLDGRLISSLPALAQLNAASLGFATNLPDATDKVLKAKSNVETLGQTGGNNNVVLVQNNLPNVNFTGTTSVDGSHTHSHSDQHNSTIENINLVYGLLGILSGVVLNILNTNVGNKVPVSMAANSQNMGNHSHTASVSSGGSNLALPNVKHLTTNTFIYLGE